MKDFLEYLVKLVVIKPDAVKVREEDVNGVATFRLTVAPEEVGLVIGKSGKVIRALRNLVRVKAMKENRMVNVEIEETPRPEVPQSS